MAQGKPLIAGVDEAGRGPLAGPVVAAAIILDPNKPIDGLKDSKLLSARRRDELYTEIYDKALHIGVGRADIAEIESINILQASLLAMRRAVEALAVLPTRVLIDGNCCPVLPCAAEAIIKGDQKIAAISAASIIAKVSRDREMVALDAIYPGYGFAKHKGYGTAEHRRSLHQLGPTPVHRLSFIKKNHAS